MSKNAGQGNNQSAANSAPAPLTIPTLGSAPAAGPIVQEGEDASQVLRADPVDPLFFSAQTSAGRQQPASDDVVMRADDGYTNGAAPLADLQKRLDAEQNSARNRPAQIRRGRDFGGDAAGDLEFELPTTGDADRMRRPDQFIEPVNDLLRWKDKAEELAFLEELMVIVVSDTTEQGAENPVPLGVNGRMVYIWRGDPTIVRRKYVAQLFNSRVEAVKTKIVRGSDDEPKNLIVKSNGFKYPFQILRDDNPKGGAWARQMREQRR